jgi:hypothetical protein
MRKLVLGLMVGLFVVLVLSGCPSKQLAPSGADDPVPSDAECP